MAENESYDQFAQAFNWMQSQAHSLAVEKGWYDRERNGLEKLMLVVSELGEGAESIRAESISKKILGYSELEEEIADVFIRLIDHGGSEGMDLGGALAEMVGYLKKFSEQEIRLSFAMIKLMGLFPESRIAESIIAKHQYNQSRSYRHGGKKY